MGGVLRKLYEKFLIHIREFDKMYLKLKLAIKCLARQAIFRNDLIFFSEKFEKMQIIKAGHSRALLIENFSGKKR